MNQFINSFVEVTDMIGFGSSLLFSIKYVIPQCSSRVWVCETKVLQRFPTYDLDMVGFSILLLSSNVLFSGCYEVLV